MVAETDHTRPDVVALNGDIVDYSRLMADDLKTTSEAVGEYHDLVSWLVADRGGELVNFVGDNFMAVFESAMDAMDVAIAITREVEERNESLPENRRIRFRLGLDRGGVTVVGDDYHGDTLNIAARIQAMAPPGGIGVSGAVYRALDEPALRFRSLGRRELKNIPEPVEVYEFADLPSAAIARRPGPGRLALETPTVAVLPAHTEGVSDAVQRAILLIRQDLLHRLSEIPGLGVIDAGGSPERRPRESAARYMLESGVHQFDDDVRVFVTLFDVTTVNVVKSHKWTAPASDLLGLSERVADEVARAIEVDLIVGEPAGLYSELADPEAIEKVYLGWFHLRNGSPEDWQRAVRLFGEVADAHPDQPYGAVLLAYAYVMGAADGLTSDVDGVLAAARDHAAMAERLGDPTGMATAVEATILMTEGKFAEALDALEHLEMVRPTCDVTFGLEGSVRRYLGEWEKSIGLMDVAMRLTGLNKPWYPTVKACSLFVGGRLDEAAGLAESVLEHQPRNLEALLVLAAAQRELGLDRRAAATAGLIKERFPFTDIARFLDRSPYADEALVDRWKGDLEAIGVLQKV